MQPFQDRINARLHAVTKEEIIAQADKFHVAVTDKEAAALARWIRTNRVNVFSEQERAELLQAAEHILGKPRMAAIEAMLRPYRHVFNSQRFQ